MVHLHMDTSTPKQIQVTSSNSPWTQVHMLEHTFSATHTRRGRTSKSEVLWPLPEILIMSLVLEKVFLKTPGTSSSLLPFLFSFYL